MRFDTLNKDILKLAVPSILANITVPFVGIVDIAIAGHLKEACGAAALIGAIAIGSMLFDLLYWNFNFLRAGIGGLTAQAYGRNDMNESAGILSRGIGISLLSACLIGLIAWPFTKLVFMIMPCSGIVRDLALRYFFIRIAAAPATLGLMAMKGWFIGMQDGVSSMKSDLLVNGLNMVLSFALSLKIGFDGIPLGTVLAQYAGFIYACSLVYFKYRRKVFGEFTKVDLRESFARSKMGHFLKVNSDLFVRSFCLIVVYIGFTVISANYGDLLLASGAIIMKILMIFSYFTDGFAYAGEALTGRYIGMKSLPMVKKTVLRVFIWSMSIGLFFVIVYAVAAVPLFRLMTSDEAVVSMSSRFIPWLILMPLLGCPAFTWDGIYVGATATKELRNSSIWSVVGFFAVWFVGIYILNLTFDSSRHSADSYGIIAVHILMAAYFMHLVARTIYQTILYKKTVLKI